MKLKNIAINGKIQAKSSLCSDIEKGELVRVVSKEDKYYSGYLTILVERDDGCTSWECHKDFRKPRVVVDNIKQIDQSIFDGLDEKWRFAAVDKGGEAWVYSGKPDRDCGYWFVKEPIGMSIDKGYDASNWKDSLIERETAELTGNDLCRAMLERGDKVVLCAVSDNDDFKADAYDAIFMVDECGFFESHCTIWRNVKPINNQGEPLTAAEAGIGESL